MTKINKTKVQLAKRIRNKENYYVSMPVGSELHLVDPRNNQIIHTVTMESNGLRVWYKKEATQ